MAPSPEYDKEPKAPDKSGTNISCEDTKLLHNLINDQLNSSDHKTTNSATNSEVENTKHVETLDDDKLRALLNEALTYKCPKDREGKSSLFKELLQEVEADEQEACSAAARTVSACRGGGRRARAGRGPLPHSNSLQDLVAALAAEPAPRRHQPARLHPHTVAARAIHGGSLPSGVDTSSLLSEEGPARCGGAGYLATVRCVNPPPLAERRVSASDANAPHDLELLNRRSKPMFPMTYTARATLEIGSGSVCSGRAVTTTTASNQMSHISPPPADNATGGTDAHALNPSSDNYDIELEEIVCHSATKDNRDTFSDYLADQEKLFQVLEATQSKATEDEYSVKVLENNNNIKSSKHSDDVEPLRKSAHDVSSENDVNMSTNIESERTPCEPEGRGSLVVRVRAERAADRYMVAELPNNAYLFLTLPSRLLAPLARDYRQDRTSCSAKRKDTIDKNALRMLLFENLLKSDRGSPPPGRASSAADKEVDSAIPFSCITTPEVVASCNTTPSASHAAVALDPKPLQLAAEYRAATSLAGPSPATHKEPDEQPRSVIASAFNGLPLSRPHYASAASSDEYKKSLDENGNSVQGYSSPLSGSSQHKKPRRKKSSRNETVIDCRQLDGYQGDKDVNELLRFIESAEQRAPKLRKHKDDADDKGKKRSAERRKDKERKPARAASLDELSRCREPPRAPPAKPERRSWGDAEPALPDAPPDLGFQTVTKKRRARRRAEEAPRRARAGAAARRLDCARSDRSNDSTDDMDSVHSLPAPAPPAAPAHLASYADIARTRHNIPDLIESCNFYAEGELEPEPEPERAPAAPPDAFPALEPRAASPAPPHTELAPEPEPAPAPAAPDVVADRRPPVILLDSAARPRDLDGVTFGFDINEQLLGGGARRARCDLLREAEAEAVPVPVPVRLAKRALQYVPPPPPPDRAHLLRIVDYIGGAWEEAMRCGEGKVRYFSG